MAGNGSVGGPVPPLRPDQLAQAMGTGFYYAEAGKPGDVVRAINCQECARLGHICRPCRKRRYEARHTEPVDQSPPWWWVWAIFTAVAVLAALAWGCVYG